MILGEQNHDSLGPYLFELLDRIKHRLYLQLKQKVF